MMTRTLLTFLTAATATMSVFAAGPLLTPAPRNAEWTADRFPLDTSCTISAESPQEEQIARVLAAEIQRRHGLRLRVARGSAGGPRIVIALRDSPVGRAWLAKDADLSKWTPERNAAESYWLEVRNTDAVVLAESPRGLLYGCQTLLQLVEPARDRAGAALRGVEIRDYPQLSFRAVHVCIFPNTELAAVRQAILLAARYKFNAVVLEPWASLQSATHPETAYAHAYTPEQIRPLIELGRALHLEVIPMLNSWGHASGMRSTSFEHVVLDRSPEQRALFEPDGWSFNLSNPVIYEHLFDRYGELLELFGPVRYFHVGMDEAWGHLGLAEAGECRGDNPRELLVEHMRKIHGYFAQRKIRVLMWHDMFIQRDHPQLGRLTPANSVPPINSHLALDELPKDVVIAAWNYGVSGEWPVPKYFRDRGFPVVVSPWKHRANTLSLLSTAKRLDLMGVLTTTWDSLDVSLPSVAQAGVLAWTAPGFDLKQVPYDHWLGELRQLPIDRLPSLETTLKPPTTSAAR